MEKKEFLDFCTTVFREIGYSRKGQTYYLDGGNDLIAVFGLMKSSYGAYYYIECGLAIKNINKYLPFPKFYQLDVNLPRIMFKKGKSLCYEDMDLDDCDSFRQTIYKQANIFAPLLKMKDSCTLAEYILSNTSLISHITDITAEYLGITKELAQSHGITILYTEHCY